MPNWKDHPVIAAAVIFGAAVAFFWNFILPRYVKDRELQIAEINKRIEPLEKSVREQSSELNRLKQRNLELSKENIFSTEDVYPKGFRQVRIGDSRRRFGTRIQRKTWRMILRTSGFRLSLMVS
jgi:hypothetical protein